MGATASSPAPRLARALRPHLLPGAVFAAATVVLLREGVFLGRALYARDLHLWTYPMAESLVRGLAEGSLPLWEPFVSFGQPRLANPETQILYPTTALHLLLRPWTVHLLLVASHLVLGAAGTYALALRLGLGRASAVLGGLAWMASGPVLSAANLVHHFTGAAWVPWVVLGAEVAVTTRTVRAALLWGLAAAAQVLAGSGDLCAMTAGVCAGWVAARAPRLDPASRRRALALAALAATVALAVSAAQWIPTMEVVARSGRRELPEAMRTYWSLHPAQLAQIVVPVLADRLPLRQDLRAALFESREALLSSVYLGVVAIVLALSALARRPRAQALLLLGFLGTAAALALGHHAPVYEAAVTLLPPLRVLRYPAKIMILASLAVALLAARGVEAWALPGPVPRRRWLALVVAPALLLGLLLAAGAAVSWFPSARVTSLLALDPGREAARVLGPTARSLAGAAVAALGAGALALVRLRGGGRRLSAAVVALAAAELLWAHRDLNPTAPAGLLRVRPPTVAELLPDLSRTYVYSYDAFSAGGRALAFLGEVSAEEMERWRGEWDRPLAEVAAQRTYLLPSVGATWGVWGSFDVDQRGLYPAPLARLVRLQRESEGTPGHLRLLQLGAVSRVLTLHRRGLGDLTLLKSIQGPYPYPIRVFAVPDPLPRAYAVSGVRVRREGAAAALLDPAFDPRREVLLEEGAERAADPAFTGSVRIVELRQDRLLAEAELTAAGHVVFVDAHDPGWRARVDGVPAPVLRANLAFRAVPVPAGRHRLELAYRPWSVLWGLGLSALGAAATALAWRASRPRKKPPPSTLYAAGETATSTPRPLSRRRSLAT